VGITIRDVAEAAGVSPATVSRALRGMPNVNASTRARIKSAAARLDYVASPSASRLASGRTGSIAVITPYISRWYFSTVLSGVESVLQAAGMDLLLLCLDDKADSREVPSAAQRLRRRVDGALIIAMPPTDPQVREVLDLGMPTSLIGVTTEGVPGVAIDDTQAARLATQHLVNLGHERIGLIGGSSVEAQFTAESDRERGYRQVLRDNGIALDASLMSSGYFTISGGERAMTNLLTLSQPPTAVFAMSDEMAFGALRSLSLHGLVPGRDVSIVGIDGHDVSEHLNLTTVAQPVGQLGRLAAESLLLQIQASSEDPIPGVLRVPTQLQVRGSTGPRSTPRS
jgi:LacI family transcriptional regulator, repressor for deo operon, udp, cdd, tsx, nupC, and nupG